MNLPEDNVDPFTDRDLWRSSAFTFQPLQPLEHPRWDDDLPGKSALSPLITVLMERIRQ